MKKDQSLFDITRGCLEGLENVISKYQPGLIFVQGDTTTAFIGALVGFYKKIKVAHIEAGLRSKNKYFPFPEEMNRVLISHLSDFHFAPTSKAKDNLKGEGIVENIWVVGNTVIDALFLGLKIVKEHGEQKYKKFFNFIDFSKKIILVTGHRRESFGEPFRNICYAIKEIVHNFNDIEIVYPVHFNPNVRKPVMEILNNHPRIHLIDPLTYPYLIWLMKNSYIILTDSGGIQEEAPSLGKPVLVMREVTERVEGIKAGTAKLVGTYKEKIIEESLKLLRDNNKYKEMVKTINPYGNGTASRQIVKIISNLKAEI
jgi:UDP-N-acetylglucosamine 2-epimerase (non-hydrolysing)